MLVLNDNKHDGKIIYTVLPPITTLPKSVSLPKTIVKITHRVFTLHVWIPSHGHNLKGTTPFHESDQC